MVEVGEQQYNVVWKTPAQTTSSVALRPVFPAQCSAMDDAAGEMEGTGVVRSWRMQCDGGLIGQDVEVVGLSDNQASVLASLEAADGSYYQSLLNTEQPVFSIPETPSVLQVVQEYSWLGADHIWGGIDHLLFVFGLLLLVGGGKRLLWTITAFTLGHSITLSLVTLGYFDYPVALVEFTIALSVFILALELSRKDRSGLLSHYPWWLAGGFGLLHGMGFAGALSEVGLPQGELPLALLFFNIGIELGQLAFIALIFALWLLVRNLFRGQEHRWLPLPVYVLGALSAMWCIERGLEVF
ncbi:HupE/UreJ family protein [Halieaceae bacterium IMCC14734]|uniref:HupE/UreJ family protein n=2 Tax=Candidatus Litorirhabdus singularis TaxID=2518993 RepID=A0ABT3THG8_9GAMM|nr:HupE/UreJ family protein [Candidatus Litorirhabdus singularis]